MTPWQIAVGNFTKPKPCKPLDPEYKCKECGFVKPTAEFRIKNEKGCKYRCGICRECENARRRVGYQKKHPPTPYTEAHLKKIAKREYFRSKRNA